METARQRIVPAGSGPGWLKPPGAANSAFDTGVKAKAHKRSAPPDPAAVLVRSGVPVPPLVPAGGPYLALFDRMKPGDCCDLTPSQARSMWGTVKKKRGESLVMRSIDDTTTRVWRPAAKDKP